MITQLLAVILEKVEQERNSKEVYKILDARVEEAFTEEVVDESALSLCAALASKQGGDARFALDLLKYAGDITSRKGAHNVTDDEIEEAREIWEKEHVDRLVADFSLK